MRSLKRHKVEAVHDGHEFGALREVRREVGRDAALGHRRGERELHVHLLQGEFQFSIFFSLSRLEPRKRATDARPQQRHSCTTRVRAATPTDAKTEPRPFNIMRFCDLTSLFAFRNDSAGPSLPCCINLSHDHNKSLTRSGRIPQSENPPI